MPRRGRPSKPIPSIEWKVYIPIPLAAKADLLLLDPVTNKTRYGARSDLVANLLASWLAEQTGGNRACEGDNNVE